MDKFFDKAYYRLEINTDNGGALVHDFSDYHDDWARLYGMIHYIKQELRFGYVLYKYDKNDTGGTYSLMGKYEESTAIG